MDAITLIVTALAAGAVLGVQETASAAVKDAYASLKALVRKRFAGRAAAELALASHQDAPQAWHAGLAAELSEAGAGADADLVAAAQALMSLVDVAGSRAGKYAVNIRDTRGAQIGDRNTQENNFIGQYVETQIVSAPSGPAAWPVRVGAVPQMPPAFQPRAAVQAALGSRGSALPPVGVVTGMRGVGKTQAAAAYARSRMADGWRLVAWVSAGDMTAVLDGLAEVAAQLGIHAPGGDLESAAAAVRHWLETDGDQCLLVFDNVADPEEVRPFIPAAGKAQIVITSSFQTVGDLGLAAPVEVFSEDEALAFLAERTRSPDVSGARELTAELGSLPLALAHAAAVIARQRLSYPMYLDRLRRMPAGDYLARAQGDPYPRGISAAVLLSMDSAGAADSSDSPGLILNLIAVLASAGVSRELLYEAGRRGVLGPAITPGEAPISVDAALAQLADASLLTFSIDGSKVSGHRLVMRIIRELRAREGSLAAVGAAATTLLAALSEPLEPAWRNPRAVRDLIQQVRALQEHFGLLLAGTNMDLGRNITSLGGWALGRMNELADNPAQAVEYGRPLVAELERVLGCDHPDTMTARANLARACRSAGRLAEALTLFEVTLADHERVLGADHPDTLTARGELAYAYRSADRLDQAIPLYEHTHRESERVLGTAHPATLAAQNYLAHAYAGAGRLAEAITLYESALAGREQVLGSDHIDSLLSRTSLAHAYQRAGRIADAIPLQERASADFERVLGSDHPFTLSARENLASAYQAAGQLREAISLYEAVLDDRKRVLGEDNPDIMRSQNALAAALQQAGQTEAAIQLFTHALADCERILDADHPLTRTVRENLASTQPA